jgi:hypothetical protein
MTASIRTKDDSLVVNIDAADKLWALKADLRSPGQRGRRRACWDPSPRMAARYPATPKNRRPQHGPQAGPARQTPYGFSFPRAVSAALMVSSSDAHGPAEP